MARSAVEGERAVRPLDFFAGRCRLLAELLAWIIRVDVVSHRFSSGGANSRGNCRPRG